MSRNKVTVVGAGHVGATTAHQVVLRGLADCVLVDIVEGMPQGKALDLNEAAPLDGYDYRLTGANDYKAMEGSDAVVVTAGLPRKPGMSREDLVQKNTRIVSGIAEQITKHAPKAIVIIVSNPLDIMTHLAWSVTGFDKHRIMGMAGVLDSARLRYFIAERLKVSVKEVSAMVLGGHGDLMVPLVRFATVSGVPLSSFLKPDEIASLVERTRQGGAEIVKLLKQGSAYYAPAASAAVMVESILQDQHQLLPCCVSLSGQYGLKDVFCGVPVKLGRRGVEEIVELDLNSDELSMLKKSADAVRKGIEASKVST
jgi:malate dehydrogenase